MKEFILMTCPVCEERHRVKKGVREGKVYIKGKEVSFNEIFYFCDKSNFEENEFVPAKVMDENLLRARDAYRKEVGLLTSEEIAKIRSFFGLTQSDFSALLGWGDITITRYETKSIQDETYDEIMRLVYNDPLFALENLDKHKNRFDKGRYFKIRQNIINIILSTKNKYLIEKQIYSYYLQYYEKSVLNGYKILDLKKVISVIKYFSNFVNHLFKVKLMKLLWYTDVVYYNRHKTSMMGLVYTHHVCGALPIAYDNILSLPGIEVSESLINYNIAYKIIPSKDLDISEFTIEELEVLNLVAKKFKDYKAEDIIDYMHQEKAYEKTNFHQIIPYSLCNDLNELK
jgi:putative zinc finger/helix-turn-helix YgiT family protein